MGCGQDLEEGAPGWTIKCLRKGSVTGRSKHIVARATRYSSSEWNKTSTNTPRLINKQGKCTQAHVDLPRWHGGEESACYFRDCKRCGFHPWVGKISREGNCIPLQYSCLENPMDRGAWRAIVHGVSKVGHGWAHSILAHVHIYTCSCMNTEVLAHTLSIVDTGMQSFKSTQLCTWVMEAGPPQIWETESREEIGCFRAFLSSVQSRCNHQPSGVLQPATLEGDAFPASIWSL